MQVIGDNVIAQSIAEALRHGLKVWLDNWALGPGDSLIDRIQEGINQSDARKKYCPGFLLRTNRGALGNYISKY